MADPIPADVTLREITAETLLPILKLEVAPHQKAFVAANAYSIAEAHFEEKAWFRGIYAGDEPVGFVMLYVDTEKPEYVVWRFMVGERHQGKGHGAAAMLRVIEHVRGLPEATTLKLSYVPKDGNPAPFYRRFGFAETGEVDAGENVMVLEL